MQSASVQPTRCAPSAQSASEGTRTSVPDVHWSPRTRADARATAALTKASCIASGMNTRDAATHSCPALKKLAPHATRDASSTSVQSGHTINGFLPPSSSVDEAPRDAAAAATERPAATEPVNDTCGVATVARAERRDAQSLAASEESKSKPRISTACAPIRKVPLRHSAAALTQHAPRVRSHLLDSWMRR